MKSHARDWSKFFWIFLAKNLFLQKASLKCWSSSWLLAKMQVTWLAGLWDWFISLLVSMSLLIAVAPDSVENKKTFFLFEEVLDFPEQLGSCGHDQSAEVNEPELVKMVEGVGKALNGIRI